MKGEWIRRPVNGKAVVYVHGVLSSGESCWQNSNGTYWPALLRDEPSTADIGVYVFTYKTNIFSGTYRLGDAVDALKEHMRLDGLLDCHTLVFVAHSMGGLVTRKLLVERVTEFRERTKSIGLFLVASPSLGSNYANMIAPIARLLDHTQADALRFSQTNTWLMDLDREFLNLKEAGTLPLVGKELVEDVFIIFPSVLRRQVVEPFSGFRYFGEPYKVPDSNHFSIAKPESAEAIQHRLLLKFIIDLKEPAKNPLPIEAELRTRLEARLNACKEAELPFRNFHKLAALLAMQSGFATHCFNTPKADTAARIQAWLQGTIQAQRETDRNFGTPGGLDDDEAIARAMWIARDENANEVNERHLLLALLSDEASGTIREIRERLGMGTFEVVCGAARSGRPSRVRLGSSAVPSLDLWS